MSPTAFHSLLDKYLSGSASPAERQLLEAYYEALQNETPFELSEDEKEKLKAAMWQNIQPASGKSSAIVTRSWFSRTRFLAAAVFVLLLCTTGYFLLRNKEGKTVVENNTVQIQTDKKNLQPNKATLTLSDGRTIVLDDAQNSELARQGATKIIKLDGKLSYNGATAAGEVLYNTITTPRGGQYQVVLPDGSQVWLNSASSLRLPTSFVGRERKVEITGEAYFEVAKNKAMPFVVEAAGAKIRVTGTSFNINSYGDEPAMNTTLLEGSISLVNAADSIELKPGQQGRYLPNTTINVLSGVDTDEVMAWKNGLFHFENAGLKTVMRQLSRWYDVDVVYKADSNEEFYLEMPRTSSLRDVLKVLELSGNIHFKIEGNVVTVVP